jgi:hypothetical protein
MPPARCWKPASSRVLPHPRQPSPLVPALQQQPAYRAALESIPNMATLYAPYYPQPATRLACNRSRPQGLALQWGASATTRPKCTACSATSTHSTA